MAKLSCEDVIRARKLYELGVSIKSLSEQFNMLPKAISQMVRGITYKNC